MLRRVVFRRGEMPQVVIDEVRFRVEVILAAEKSKPVAAEDVAHDEFVFCMVTFVRFEGRKQPLVMLPFVSASMGWLD